VLAKDAGSEFSKLHMFSFYQRRSFLSHIECKYTLSFEEALHVLAYLKGAYTYGGAGEEEVARLEHKELANVTYQLVYAEEHIGCVPMLYGVAVDVEAETDVLHMGKTFYGDELAQYGRSVKTFAKFPRKSLTAKAFLQVAGGDIYTHGDSVVIAVGKAWGNILAQLVDAHYQLGLVVEPLGKVGNEKGLPALKDGRIGFHEYYGAVWQGCCSVEFSMVFGIVHAYADNLHGV